MTVLVTGGGGFIGSAIVRRLHAGGRPVRVLARGRYPWLARLGVDARQGDVARADDVGRALEGCESVFHVAARAGVWGDPAEYRRTNVEGTANVIEACRREGVARLIFTSSPSVVFAGRDEEGIDERAPYPSRYLAAYPRTKAAAERAVLAANRAGLATVALRPHLVWGPGDPHLVPRILSRARAGRLRLVGDGSNRVDSTYVENAAAAHLLAEARLAADPAIGGRAYFISNGEPLPIGELLDRILAAAGLPPLRRRVPALVAYAAGAVLETAHRCLRRQEEPAMTRFVARSLSAAHWYDLSAARRDLGYAPEVSIDEGMRRLGRWLSDASA